MGLGKDRCRVRAYFTHHNAAFIFIHTSLTHTEGLEHVTTPPFRSL